MQPRNGPPPGLVDGKNAERAAQAQDDGMAVLASVTTFAQLAKTGFTASMTLKASPGSYAVRAVCRMPWKAS